MADQTQVALARKTFDPGLLTVDLRDRAILKRLSAKVAELAARPVEDEKRALWYAHNSLKKTRPLIFCDPENGWNEIITDKDLECSGELARDWEYNLRKEIFWGEQMLDDRVIEPFFTLPYIFFESDWGMHETKIGGINGGSYVWDAPLKDYADINKITFPSIEVDYDMTGKMLSLADDILGDNLTVRIKGKWWWTLGMTWTLVNLRGLEQVMYDCYDHPEGLRDIMAVIRDGTLAKLDFLEKNGLLGLNNDGTYVGSGGFGWTSELPQRGYDGSRIRTADMWGFCESQETTTWSPDMFEEFVFPYQVPVMERFGINCYGCCEPLDKRWHIVKKFPRLRRVSVSPWANFETMADYLKGDYIYSYKPIPTDIATPVIDEERIRKGLKNIVDICSGCRLEIIMKDNHTIGGKPENVINWCRIAREEAENAG